MRIQAIPNSLVWPPKTHLLPGVSILDEDSGDSEQYANGGICLRLIGFNPR